MHWNSEHRINGNFRQPVRAMKKEYFKGKDLGLVTEVLDYFEGIKEIECRGYLAKVESDSMLLRTYRDLEFFIPQFRDLTLREDLSAIATKGIGGFPINTEFLKSENLIVTKNNDGYTIKDKNHGTTIRFLLG